MSDTLAPEQTVTSSSARRRVPKVAIGATWAAAMYVGVTGGPSIPPRALRVLDDGRTSFQQPIVVFISPEDVAALRDASGLSWQQIADAVGVSRRAVHYWANGGNVSAPHRERLEVLTREIESFRALGPEEARAHLLATDETGASRLSRLIDAHRAQRPQGLSAVDRLSAVEDGGTASDTGTTGRTQPLNFNPHGD